MSFSTIASLLEYPGPDYQTRVRDCLKDWDRPELTEFAAKIAAMPMEACQELYTQTFDWNPDTTLDIGWHLFGENYDRGDFLVKLRGAMRMYGLPESSELPDHLSHVLPLLDHMPPAECATFTAEFVTPALDKLGAGLKKAESIYLPLVAAIREQVYILTAPVPSGATHA